MSKYTTAEAKIVADFETLIKKQGWQPMETGGIGGAWFGGKSHYTLADYLPSEVFDNANLEDIDFLVLGWRV